MFRGILGILMIFALLSPLPVSGQRDADTRICGLSDISKVGQAIELFTKSTGLFVTFSSNQVNTQDSVYFNDDCLNASVLLDKIFTQDMALKWYPDKIIIYSRPDRDSRRQIDLYGTVVNAQTREKLIAATVYLPEVNKGTITNDMGFFNMENVPVGTPILISYVGFQPLLLSARPGLSTEVIELFPSIELEAVEVLSERLQSFELLSNADKLYIPSDPYNSGPFLGGEPDILKMIQNGAGVVANEVASGPIVRGGSPDQNLVLLDDVPLYEYNHLLGFVSIFNSEIINRVDFYKGSFPSRYGGRLSSVIDIKTRDGDRSEWHGNMTLGIFAQKLEIDGPIDKQGRFTLIGSSRISTLKPLIDILPIDEIKGFSPQFWDAHLKLTGELSPKDRLSLLLFKSRDNLNNRDINEELIAGIPVKQTKEESLDWGNEILSLKWSRRWSRKVFSNTTLFLNNFEFGSQNFQGFVFQLPNEEIEENYDFLAYSSIRDRGLKSSWDYQYNDQNIFNFGIELISHRFNPALRRADRLFEDHEKEEIKNADTYSSMSFSSYGEWTFHVTPDVKAVSGIRYSLFNTANKNYHRWHPRISLVWEFIPRVNLSTGYSRTSQFIHLLGTPVVGYPTDLWVPSTAEIKPQHSDQLFVNISTLINDLYFIQLSGFYKSLDHLISFRDGTGSISSDWEDQIITGKGRARGLEASFEKNKGIWQWGLYYTLSKSTRSFTEINNGNEFPSRFDRTHDLKLRVHYHLNKESQIGVQWTLSSGQPFTVGVLSFQPQGPPGIAYPPTVYFGDRNNERMPWLHRLDISFNINRVKGRLKQEWSVGLYNLYNRFNPFAVEVIPEEQSQQIILKETSLYPLLPFLTYKLSY